MNDDFANTDCGQAVVAWLLDGYEDTELYSRSFKDEHGMPPSKAAKSQHLRSVLQASIDKDDRFARNSRYSELGKVRFSDSEGNTYQFKSTNAHRVERGVAGHPALFELEDFLVLPKITILIYEFTSDELLLSLAAGQEVGDQGRIKVISDPIVVLVTPLITAESSGFEQSASDLFTDLGTPSTKVQKE